MHTLLNPYIAGAPIVEPSMFFGRQDVFQWIERSLSGKFVDHILVIHGQRRVGKTSVLKQIPNFLPKTYIQVFFDLQGRTSTTLDRFLWWLGREIARVLRQSHGVVVPVPDQEEFTKDRDYLHAQFLPAIQPLLGEHKLLLTFDEFDTLEQPEIRETLGRPLIDYLRRLFELETLNFIFSIGSSGRKLENMQASYTDFFKTALYRKISFLSREDCQKLIARPVEGVLQYDLQAIERIYAVTTGHPYFTQLVCHELFSQCQKTGKRAITEGDVEVILDDVIERGTVNLKFTWDEASNLEKWILACLAQVESAVSMAELSTSLQRQRVRALDPDLNAALLHLREKDIVTEQNRFVVYLLHRWLQKNRPLDRVREELVEVNPIANRYIEIGEEYHAIGHTAKAIESFQQALAVDPQNLKAQTSIASIYLDQKDYPTAAQAFEKALAIDDEDVSARTGVCDAYLALGEAALALQDVDQAVGYFQRVLEVNWEHGEARQRLADIYSQQAEAALAQGDDDGALAALSEALRFAPEDEALLARHAQVQELMREKALAAVLEKSQQEASAGRWEQAIAPLEEALQATPGEPRLLEALEAVRSARRRAQLGALRQQAQRVAAAEQWDAALEAWRGYLALAPDDASQAGDALQHAEAQRELASAYQEAQHALEKKDYGRAVSLLKKVVLQDETYKDSARLLALAIEGQRKRRRSLVFPKWAGPALAGAVLLVGLVFLGVRFGPSWMEALKPAAQVQPTASMAAAEPLVIYAGASQPAWVEAFANPVLQAIQARPPDFEDDFSTPKAEWDTMGGQSIENLVTEGVLRVGSGGIGASSLNTPDFALQFDFLPPIGEYKFGFRYRGEADGGNYGLWFQGGNWDVYVQEADQKPYLTLAGESESPEIVPSQWTRVLLIVRGVEHALFLNGKPMVYVQDHRATGNNNYFGFDEGAKTLDNVKFWRLEPPSAAETAKAKPGVGRKACFVDDVFSSIDDNGYGENAWKGVQDAMDKLGVEGKYLDAGQEGDYPELIDASIADGCDLIVTLGFLLSEDTQKAADAHPQQMFHIVDIDLDPPKPNVLGQHFEVEEGTFLAGYLAAALSRTGKVGTLGGMQIPPVTAYMDGFARGVDYYNQQKAGDVQVLGWDLAAQTGAFVGDFADRDGYKNKAAELIGAGVDILMPVGPPGNGAEIAAKEAGNVMLIGVDSDWYEALPEYREIMLTSVMKNIDVLTYKAIQSMVDGSFAGGTLVGSLKNVGVSLAPFHELEDRVPAVLRAEINKIKAGINTGSIPEPDPASIEGQPPDFEDDFASRRPEWRLDDRGSKIAGGSMVLVVEENGQGANAGGDHLNATDFVLEFDFQRTSQDCIDCAIVIWYRGNDQSSYGLDLSLGPGAMRWVVVKVQDGIKEEFHQGDIPRVDPPASHHFRLVAQGDAFRFYLDQELATYWQEAALTGSSIGIGSRNLGGTSWIQIDNLKLWSLDPAWPKEIRNRPPDFEDDFSPPKEEWKLMGLSDELNIEDYVTEGVLRLGPEARQLNAPTLTAANFVIEFDFLPPTDAVYKFGFRFRGEADGRDYSLYFWERDWGLLLTYPAQQDWPALTEGRDSPEIVPGQWTHVLLIVQGDQYTLYLNGKPVGYIRDDTLHGDQNDFNFAEGSKTLDNVKFWSLDPAWAKEIPNRPPDFEDDFSSLKPDWKKERYIGGFGVTEGVLRLSKNALVGEHSLQALDYVFQTDLRLNEITENMMILCSLRLTEYEGGKYGTEYQVHIYPWEKYWEIFVIKVPRGQWEPVKEGELQAFKPGQWIHLTIAISGDSVRIYWDDELLVEYQGLELTGEMNQIGVFTESDTFRLDLDNWKFWKLE